MDTEILSDERFAELFGFCLVRLSQETQEKAATVNAMFDALSDELGIEDRDIFRLFRREDEYLPFILNIASCPDEIIDRVQHMLAPDSLERKSQHLIKTAREGKR